MSINSNLFYVTLDRLLFSPTPAHHRFSSNRHSTYKSLHPIDHGLLHNTPHLICEVWREYAPSGACLATQKKGIVKNPLLLISGKIQFLTG